MSAPTGAARPRQAREKAAKCTACGARTWSLDSLCAAHGTDGDLGTYEAGVAAPGDQGAPARCGLCQGAGCEEGCGRCEHSPSTAGPDAHRQCTRCLGAGVAP